MVLSGSRARPRSGGSRDRGAIRQKLVFQRRNRRSCALCSGAARRCLVSRMVILHSTLGGCASIAEALRAAHGCSNQAASWRWPASTGSGCRVARNADATVPTGLPHGVTGRAAHAGRFRASGPLCCPTGHRRTRLCRSRLRLPVPGVLSSRAHGPEDVGQRTACRLHERCSPDSTWRHICNRSCS